MDFVKSYFDRNEPDLEKNGGQKCSTGQRFISIKVLLTESILWLSTVNEGLGLWKLADTVLILINPSPSNVKYICYCVPHKTTKYIVVSIKTYL